MLLPILSFFLLLAAGLVTLGYATRESMFVVAGFGLLFIVGSLGMAEGGVSYQSGETRTTEGNVTTITYDYTTYTPESWFGFRPFFWLTVLAVFGFVLSFLDFSERFRRYEND